MPTKPGHPCAHPGCLATTSYRYCNEHRSDEVMGRCGWDNKQPSQYRGYGARWRNLRASVLCKYGIPHEEWSRYDVHHSPAYDPEIEPDHAKYELTPMLRSDHMRLTAREGARRRLEANKGGALK